MRIIMLAVLMLSAGSLMAFGVPDVPDVPDVDVPDIEIPGLDILDGIQVQLNELIASTDSLVWLIPELSALEDVSLKLEELRETDPEIAGLQAEIDALRGELLGARAQIEEISLRINSDIGAVTSSLNTFVEGLPISIE